MSADLSVIIVSWNTRDLLLGCLRSLAASTDAHQIEVIVVDNASGDGSPEAVRQEFPNVILIENQYNQGFAKANNAGIGESTGKYICLINSDVVVTKDCLSRMRDYMNGHPGIAILGPRVLNGDLTLQPSCRQFPSPWNMLCRALALDAIFPKRRLFGGYLMSFWSYDTIQPVDVLSGCFWMIRRLASEGFGLLDESFFIYGEDLDYCKRSRLKGWENVYFPEAEAIHFGGASSAASPVRFEVENLRGTLQYLRKHHRLLARIVISSATFVLYIRRLMQATTLYVLKPSRRRSSLTRIKANVACVLCLLRLASLPARGGMM